MKDNKYFLSKSRIWSNTKETSPFSRFDGNDQDVHILVQTPNKLDNNRDDTHKKC